MQEDSGVGREREIYRQVWENTRDIKKQMERGRIRKRHLKTDKREKESVCTCVCVCVCVRERERERERERKVGRGRKTKR